jgi:hypothetical protein
MTKDTDREDPSFPPEGSASRTLTESLRRAVMGGVGNLIASEETLRAVVRDLRLPKELVQTVLAQVDATKGEVVQALRRELRGFLASMDAQTLMQKALSGMVLELKAEVRFRPDENGGLVPQVKVNSHTRRAGKEPKKKRKASR